VQFSCCFDAFGDEVCRYLVGDDGKSGHERSLGGVAVDSGYQRAVQLDETKGRELTDLLGHGLSLPLAFSETMDLRGTAGRVWINIVGLIGHETRNKVGLRQHELTAHRLDNSSSTDFC
jgi:hypothetical protein